MKKLFGQLSHRVTILTKMLQVYMYFKRFSRNFSFHKHIKHFHTVLKEEIFYSVYDAQTFYDQTECIWIILIRLNSVRQCCGITVILLIFGTFTWNEGLYVQCEIGYKYVFRIGILNIVDSIFRAFPS